MMIDSCLGYNVQSCHFKDVGIYQAGRSNDAFQLYSVVGISEFSVGNFNWNAPLNRIYDSESWTYPTIPDLKIQDGSPVH